MLDAIVSAWPGIPKGICGRHGPDRGWFAVSSLVPSALLLASHGLTLAQRVPPTVEPGTVQKRLERAPKPKAAPPIDIPDPDRLTPPPGAEGIIDGFTDIEVIEGYIDNVVIEGEQSGPAAQIEDRIEAIKASQPLRAPDRGKFRNCGTQHALNLEEGRLSWAVVPGAPSRL